MRNLKNISHTTVPFETDLPLTGAAWDSNTDSILCAFGPTRTTPVIEIKKCSQSSRNGRPASESLTSWDAPCPLPELGADEVLRVHHVAQDDSICLVLAGGDIVVVRTEPLDGQDKIEIVGTVDAGITAATWAPDGELFALTTRANTLLFMTSDFENIVNTTFDVEDAKLSKHVSVGWGKSETQFKGKRSKALRDPTIPEKVDEGSLSPYDQKRATISWRGDGSFVAVNSVEENSRRMIRIFTREGVLDSVSEPVDGLEGSMSWRPAGNLIACIQRLGGLANVIFFERNGLRHGQFPLRMPPDQPQSESSAINLDWNIDSTVLAVSFADRVELWTMGNYHYYLKQVVDFPVTQLESYCRVCWHQEEPLRIALWQTTTDKSLDEPWVADSLPTRSLHLKEYIFTTTTSAAIPPNDLGTTAVIDGRILRLTPLRKANVPPPMALHELSLPGDAQDVALNFSSTKLAVLQGLKVTVLRYMSCSTTPKQPSLERDIDLPNSTTCLFRQLCFNGEDEIFVLATDRSTSTDVIYDVERSQFFNTKNVPQIVRLFPSFEHHNLCVAALNGCFEIDGSNPGAMLSDPVVPTLICEFPTITPWIEVTRIGESTVAFALTKEGRLFANERELVRNCTSFVVTPSHLIVTTSNHLLKFIHLGPVSDMEAPPDLPEADERCRSVERGARLVTVMPTTFAVVLQMPRGNLETVYPRALVLAGIRRSIEERDYKTAFFACRSQRVDMNILHDHEPEQFLANVELIVKQLSKAEHIDLLLSQLREEDVSKTMYKDTLPKALMAGTFPPKNGPTIHETHITKVSSKVNRICAAFLAALQDRYSTNMQNVITAYVCHIPPKLDSGLSIISKLRREDPELADAAVEHICFLADVNQVYDCALGLYDLDLTLLVAQQSQKDPREYLPYLQDLQKLPELRRRFKIDDQLRRYVKALKHLHSLDAFEELQAYVQKHKLYLQALDFYRYNSERHNLLLRMYGEFLQSRNRYREAATVFESLSDYSAACESYRAINLWQEALSCASLIPLDRLETSSLARSLSDSLVESKDFNSAAVISKDYLSDIDTAAKYFCKGFNFSEAIRIVSLHARPELIEQVIDPGLVESSATLTELLSDCKIQLNAQVPRLRELRVIKSQDPLSFYEGAEATDIPDNVSLAPTDTSTSGGSLFTRYTNRTGTINTTTTRKTSKNRRREERKRARGKKGSVYEEEYLVSSIGRLVQRVNSEGDDVQRTVEALLRRQMTERARAVDAAMAEVVELCKTCLAEVFGDTSGPPDTTEDGGLGHERPAGAEGVPWDSVEELRKTEMPILKPYLRSSLLAHSHQPPDPSV